VNCGGWAASFRKRNFGHDIGVGDDYNEDLMASLAEASDANYYM